MESKKHGSNTSEHDVSVPAVRAQVDKKDCATAGAVSALHAVEMGCAGGSEDRTSEKDSKREYMKRWRQENAAHRAEYQKQYLAAHPEVKARSDKKYYETHIKTDPEKIAERSEYQKQRAFDNPEYVRELNNQRAERYRVTHREELARKANEAYHNTPEEERKAAREARTEYYKKWREEHKEEVRAQQKQYYEGNKAEIAEQKRVYYLANREQCLDRVKKQHKANPQAMIDRCVAWNKAHPEVRKALAHARRTRIKGSGGKYKASDIARLRKIQKGKCAGLGDNRCIESSKRGLTVDHVMPVTLDGSSVGENLQLLCRSCNSRKQSMHPDKWAARLGKLFV